MITLEQAMRCTTPQALGETADTFDVEAYNEALARVWPWEQGKPRMLKDDQAYALCSLVLQGIVGRDELGRDWVRMGQIYRKGAVAP